MRVILAAQILSHSLSAAILTCVDKGLLPPESKATAEFLGRFNDLWDVLNSSSPMAPGHKAAITNATLVACQKWLEECEEWISHWTFEDQRPNARSSTRRSLPFQECLLVTLSSFRGLMELLLRHHGYAFVCTRVFNQDTCENEFAQLRRDQGGFNRQPEAGKAIQLLKLSSVSRLFNTSSNSNCEETGDVMLLQLGKLSAF
jgi:hypothetical protein